MHYDYKKEDFTLEMRQRIRPLRDLKVGDTFESEEMYVERGGVFERVDGRNPFPQAVVDTTHKVDHVGDTYIVTKDPRGTPHVFTNGCKVIVTEEPVTGTVKDLDLTLGSCFKLNGSILTLVSIPEEGVYRAMYRDGL